MLGGNEWIFGKIIKQLLQIFFQYKFVQRHGWTNDKGVNLTADLYSGEHIIKSRQVEIWDNKIVVFTTI